MLLFLPEYLGVDKGIFKGLTYTYVYDLSPQSHTLYVLSLPAGVAWLQGGWPCQCPTLHPGC